MPPPSWNSIGPATKLTGEGPFAVTAAATDLVVVKTGDRLRAFEGRCPHQGALLAEGELQGEHLVCRNHRWRFDLQTGRREGGPGCLRACPIEARGDELFVDTAGLEERPAAAVGARRRLRDLPGPPSLPLLGSAYLLDPPRIHLQLEEWARAFGPLYHYRFGPLPVLVVSDVEMIQPVLRERPETFRRGSNLEGVFRELGVEGVFSSEGASWRVQRRLSMEALSHRHLRGFYGTLATVAERLRRRWERSASRGESLVLAEELKRFTVDVTTSLVFGYDINTIEQEHDVIQRKLELLFPAFNRRLFSVVPWWRLFRLPRDRQVDRAVAELRVWLTELVGKARGRLLADAALAERPSNFLEAMLAARDDAGEPFTDDVVFGNAMTMLLAGEDTTAYSLAWAVHHLLDSPPSVDALRKELRDRLGGRLVPADFEEASGLVYAGAVANEAMRLRPVAPLLFLESLVDTSVADVDVPRGTLVAVLTRLPAADAAHFGAPTEFRPDRWIDAASTGGPHDPGAHLPFGSGPRICPGRSLALLEMKVVLATLYRNFEVERVGGSEDVKERFAFTMMPVGLRVRLSAHA